MSIGKTPVLIIVIVAIVGSILILENPFASSSVVKQTQTSGPPIGTEIGWQAPNFSLQSLSGEQLSLNDFRGKIVIVNFWASWCPFCVEEMPEFEKLNREMGGKVVVLGINRAETVEKQNEFLNSLDTKITYKLLSDTDDSIAKAYNIRVMPTTFFLNENGVIAQKKLGPLTLDEMKQLVAKSYIEAGGGENAPQEPPKGQNIIKAEPQVQITNGVKHIVPLNKILSGGPPKDGIPSIDKPKFISSGEANKFLNDDDLVLGLYFDGVARAYPRMILVWHEIVNDKINGKPILITYCPLCYTGATFIRTINGEGVEFGVSGKLYNSDLVMYDRKTESYWSQILGQAIVGELAGLNLERIHVDTLEWKAWKKLHPKTEVLSKDTGINRPYGQDPYGSYYQSRELYFPVENQDNRLHPKSVVYGVELGGRAKAYPDAVLAKVIVVSDVVGDAPLLVARNPETQTVRIFERKIGNATLEFEFRNGKLYDKQTGSEWNFEGFAINGKYANTQLVSTIAPAHFWFAWAAFKPGTELFQP
ncbi:MAG: DUF3179 domain-containing protein [Thaumarchaeota archaeon]|nr:DUF3179 domain-containing protein [Nitrososphaerota archaeon]